MSLLTQPNSDGKTAAVVAIVVVIDKQEQATVNLGGVRQRTADEERLTSLTINRADVTDQRADARIWNWAGPNDRAKTTRAAAIGID